MIMPFRKYMNKNSAVYGAKTAALLILLLPETALHIMKMGRCQKVTRLRAENNPNNPEVFVTSSAAIQEEHLIGREMERREVVLHFLEPRAGDPEALYGNQEKRQSLGEMLWTQLTIESNSLRQQNRIGYLIANLKRNLRGER